MGASACMNVLTSAGFKMISSRRILVANAVHKRLYSSCPCSWLLHSRRAPFLSWAVPSIAEGALTSYIHPFEFSIEALHTDVVRASFCNAPVHYWCYSFLRRHVFLFCFVFRRPRELNHACSSDSPAIQKLSTVHA